MTSAPLPSSPCQQGGGVVLVGSIIRARLAALPSVAGSEDRAYLLATPPITMTLTAWRGGMFKGAISMPSFELLPVSSLSAISFLEACLGAAGVLARAGALAKMEALEAVDREPSMAETNVKVGTGTVDRFAVMGPQYERPPGSRRALSC